MDFQRGPLFQAERLEVGILDDAARRDLYAEMKEAVRRTGITGRQ